MRSHIDGTSTGSKFMGRLAFPETTVDTHTYTLLVFICFLILMKCLNLYSHTTSNQSDVLQLAACLLQLYM